MKLHLDQELANHLTDKQAVLHLRGEFSPELINDRRVRAIYDWQFEYLKREQEPAPLIVLEDQFPQWTFETPQTTIQDLIGRLRERYIRNEGKKSVDRLASLPFTEPQALATKMIDEGRRLNQIVQDRGKSMGTGDSDLAYSAYNDKVLKGRGPGFGFQEIDDHFYGQIGITFLLGPPKGAKSWLAVNAVVNNVMDGGFPFLYSLELDAEMTDMRLRCLKAEVPFWKYLNNQLDDLDWKRLKKASKELDDHGVFRVEKPKMGERSVSHLVERAMNAGATSIYIDQLQYLEDRGTSLGAYNDTGHYFNVCNELRDYSDQIPIFVVHQFNRSVMSASELPEAQQGKGSAAIEEVGTLILGLWASKEMRQSNCLQLGTLMSRNYTHKAWDIDVQLSRTTKFALIGESQ